MLAFNYLNTDDHLCFKGDRGVEFFSFFFLFLLTISCGWTNRRRVNRELIILKGKENDPIAMRKGILFF